jgi:3-oxoacyl-[acyl-carrier-protein] synthase-3
MVGGISPVANVTSNNYPHDGSMTVPGAVPNLSDRLRLARYSGRSRLGQLLGFRVAATGSFVPDCIVTNQDLASLGCDSDWIVQRTGIRERRKAAPEQATSDLAYEAARQCLDRAGVRPQEVDLVVVATMTPDHQTPSTACHLQRRLGCIAPAMDMNAACAGFMYALATAAHYIASGMSRRALVVGAEIMSRTIDPRDIRTYPLFGDGAGAVLLTPESDSPGNADRRGGLSSYTLGSEGCGGQLLCIPSGGSRSPLTAESLIAGDQFLKMEGRSVFKWAVRVVVDSCTDVLLHAGLRPQDLAQVILHQANIRILDAAVQDFGVPRDRVFNNLERFGNTSAASIPIALDEAVMASKIKRGDDVLLCGFGAGLSWGTGILRW